MVARIACLALTLGILVGCYDLPKPECGFACGPASECPSDYTCNTAVNRCQLVGTTPSCAAAVDAGTDTRTDTGDDVTPPTVVAMVPAANALGVPITTAITAMFSEPVDNISSLTMTLESGGIAVPADVAYSPSSLTATLLLLGPLLPGTTYTVLVRDSIIDLAGNPLGGTMSWQFTTAPDVTPPSVTSRSPGVAATGVGVGATVIVDFSEAVNGVSNATLTLAEGVTPVAGTVSYSTTPSRATLTPVAQLAANTTYTVNLTAGITDLAANPLSPVTWMFTTGADTIAPQVVVTSPVDLATAVPTTATITVQFDEPVQNVTITSFTVNGGAITGTIALSAGDTVATFTPDAALPAGATISVALTTAITDAAANALAAPVAFSFMTAP